MGLYDEIYVDYPLPGEPPLDRMFQTKEFPFPCLDHYRVDEEGQLWIERFTLEDQSDPNATGIMRLSGMMTKTNPYWERYNWTGVLELDWSTQQSYQPTPDGGSLVTTTDDGPPQTWTYVMTLVHGKVQSVTGDYHVDTQSRVVTRAEWWEQMMLSKERGLQ